MEDGSSHFRWSLQGIRKPENEMSGCTACRFTTSGRRECIGRRRSMGRSIFGERRRRIPYAEFPGAWVRRMLPIRRDMEKLISAEFQRREPVEMVPCETNDLEVPANAEIVLEGHVNLKEMRTEGPFGDHTGFYSLEGEYPVFHVECVTRRKDPMYLTTVVGPP